MISALQNIKTNMAPDTVLMRPVMLQDSEALRALYILSLNINSDGFVQDISFHGDIATRAFEYQANNGQMLGIFKDDVLIGFGGIRLSKSADNVAELCNLHLHPDYQGLGIGKRLSLQLINDAQQRGYQSIELHVTNTQTSAIGLYQRLGFKETHTHVYELFGKSYDTVFMALDLG